MTHKRQAKGILWRVLLALYALILLVILEFGKHTLLGWALALALLAAFALLRARTLSRAGKGQRLLAWLGLLLLSGAILWLSWPPVKLVPAVSGKNPRQTEIVHLQQGDLRGVLTQDGAVEVYAGIPYAEAPVGELRWREPQRAQGWDGVLLADHFAPMAMQTTNLPIYDSLAQIIGYHDYKISLSDNYRPAVSEDALYVNLWKPAGPQEKLPVLVYVHGGSLQTGQPWYADYSGEGLARQGVLVVNMAYRLGVFGFFADEALAAQSPNGSTGNYGLLDQICALEWVRDNIEGFGGDPDNVTLAGESAGSACVTALCTSPLAKGLFRRVIAESSTVTAPQPAHSFRTMEEALEAGEKTKARLGVATVGELRALPAEALVGELSVHHHITVDGYALTETPFASYQKGQYNEEARLHGFNTEESAPFILFGQASLKSYAQQVRTLLGDASAEAFLQRFVPQSDEEAQQLWADLYSAYYFSYGHYVWRQQALANGIPSYTYLFAKDNGRLGAWHSGEEVYFYGNIPAGSALYDTDDRTLSARMSGYFVNFIRTGDPNGDGLPSWSADTAADGQLMILDTSIVPGDDPFLAYYPYLAR